MKSDDPRIASYVQSDSLILSSPFILYDTCASGPKRAGQLNTVAQ